MTKSAHACRVFTFKSLTAALDACDLVVQAFGQPRFSANDLDFGNRLFTAVFAEREGDAIAATLEHAGFPFADATEVRDLEWFAEGFYGDEEYADLVEECLAEADAAIDERLAA